MWKLALVLMAGCAVDELGTDEQAIINGSLATTATYKSIVAIAYPNGGNNFFCGGVLIDAQYVLTEGTCFTYQNVNPNKASDLQKLAVWFGQDDLTTGSDSGYYVGVSQAWVKDNGADAWGNNLAILKLATPAVGYAPSPFVRTKPGSGTTTTMVGYGATSNDGNTGAGVLRKATWQTVDCNSQGVSDPALCVSATSTAACGDADYGSTLFDASGQVVAIYDESTGTDRCTQGYDVFSATADAAAWIDSIVPTASNPDPIPPPTTTGNPPDPTAPTTAPAPTVGGCSAGGGQGGLLIFALGFIARRARSKRS